MAHHDIFYTLPAGDRTYKRYQLVSLFLQEEPGEGKGTLASTYTYTVESWGRYTICLCRPANLNHGLLSTYQLLTFNMTVIEILTPLAMMTLFFA